MTVDQKKAQKQAEANAAIDANGGFGLCAMATGTGKSKIAVDRSLQTRVFKNVSEGLAKILVVVPTEKLRDEGWRDEFYKWSANYTWDNFVERTCYASLDTYKDQTWDLVILDECHNITENNSQFFKNNTVHSCIGLTATPPKGEKAKILAPILHCHTHRDGRNNLVITPTYEVTLDEAVELELVAPYDVTVITMPVNNTIKYIQGGYKNKPKMQTERERYDDLTNRVNFGSNPMKHIVRMKAIYELLSKTQTAIKILEVVIPQDIRTLIFCGTKIQANSVCQYRYYSKPTPPKKLTAKEALNPTKVKERERKYDEYEAAMEEYQGNDSFDKFINLEINRLSCCDALNEGHNIPLVDCAFIIQLKSSEKDLVQRIGRIIRHREGHIGKVIILVAEDTVDIEWAIKATNKLDEGRVRWISVKELKEGTKTINFN